MTKKLREKKLFSCSELVRLKMLDQEAGQMKSSLISMKDLESTAKMLHRSPNSFLIEILALFNRGLPG